MAEKPTIPMRSAVIALLTEETVFFELLAASAKPRSAPTEKIGDIELPSYLGDNINSIEFTEKGRAYDPKRLFRA